MGVVLTVGNGWGSKEEGVSDEMRGNFGYYYVKFKWFAWGM
jgi:hypothetical protein